MSVLALTNATVYAAGYDMTTDANKITLKMSAEELESTTFATTGYRSRIGGLKTVDGQVAGLWQSGAAGAAIDPEAFTNLGTADRVLTMAPTGTATDPAYMTQVGQFGYETFGGVGEIVPFSLDVMGTNAAGVVRGQLAAAKQTKSATGVLGSVLALGAPTAGQYVYATLHVFSAGTTISVQVQSDTASNFPSATTQATIGPITTAGGTWMTRVAGPFSGETHWRMNISVITGTFSVAGAIAVQ